MARPNLHSDRAVLEAALSVIVRKGPDRFTLDDVAVTLGITRAAILQRFGDKSTLHYRVMEHLTAETHAYFASVAGEARLEDAEAMLRELIAGMGMGDDVAGYLLLYWSDLQNDDLRELARERLETVLGEIERRLPAVRGAPAPREAARMLQSVIHGACMQWLITREGDLVEYMWGMTARLLSLLYPQGRARTMKPARQPRTNK